MSQSITVEVSDFAAALLFSRQQAMGQNVRQKKVTQSAAFEALAFAAPGNDYWRKHYTEVLRAAEAAQARWDSAQARAAPEHGVVPTPPESEPSVK